MFYLYRTLSAWLWNVNMVDSQCCSTSPPPPRRRTPPNTRLFSPPACSTRSTSAWCTSHITHLTNTWHLNSSWLQLSHWTWLGERPQTQWGRWTLCGTEGRLLPCQTLLPTIQRWHQLRPTCRRGLDWVGFWFLKGIFSRFLRLIPGGGESDLSAALRLNLMRLETNLKFRQKSFNGNCCLCIFSTWNVVCLKVVVTAPVPQILQLGGGIHARLQEQPQVLQQLEKVKSMSMQSCSSFFIRFLPAVFLLFVLLLQPRWSIQPDLFLACSSMSRSIWA